MITVLIMADGQNWLELKGGNGRLFEWWTFASQLPGVHV